MPWPQASIIGRNWPESTLDFTFKIQLMNVGLEAAIAMRQPGMLCDLLMEFSSIATCEAPGTERMLVWLSLRMRL